jgi:PPE-repeat protein
MVAIPAIPTMDWHAMPPEVNTSRLMAGAGAAPMLQAAAGWEAFAILLETQADELAASLTSLSSIWQGMAGERAIASVMPMVMWLRLASLQCHERGLKAAGQAEAWTTAMATTPQLIEIAINHITHAVLEGTNFLGINTVPIALNELDYIRMQIQSGTVMDVYHAATVLYTTFTAWTPPKPCTVPGMTEAGVATALAQTAPGMADSAVRNAAFAHVSGQSMVQLGGLLTGRVAGTAGMVSAHGQNQANRAESTAQQAASKSQPQQQAVQMATQMASQVGSSLASLPQQMGQMFAQPMQHLVQPLQQMTSLFSSSGADRAQIGMLGASPFSNHPMVGGTGASTGAGMVRAASLPGAGGTMARTPMMANLLGKVDAPVISAGAGAGGPGAGLAPVGSGGSGGPMGMHGQNKKSGGARAGLATPSLLAYDTREEEDDDW